MRPSCCVTACCSASKKLYNCGSCEEWLHEGCTRTLQWPLNKYCIFCPKCQQEPWLQGAFIQAGGAAGKAGNTYTNIKSAVEDIIKQYVQCRKAAGRTTTYSGLRSAGRNIHQQWEKMIDQHPDCNIGFRYERVLSSGSLRRSQVKWRLAMDWGDTPKTVGPQYAEALMQLANAAGAEDHDPETAAATPAAREPAVLQAAAQTSTDAFQRDGPASAAPLTCADNADATGAVANACSALEAQPIEAVQDTQAVAAAAFAVDTSSTQMANATQEPSCDASDRRHGPAATPAHSSPQELTNSAAAVTTSGNEMGLSRGEQPCAQQFSIGTKHGHSLSAAAPKAASVQTIPGMFKKRKAQSAQLPQHLRMPKIPSVELIDLIKEPLTPAASDTTSRGDFGSGHNNPDVIVLDDEAVDAGLADMSKNEVKAASPVLSAVKQPVKQPVDKQALILEMIQSLRCPR
ncbi:hypothetical protein ABBQ32_008417 [Trebouxia sp. C0010 RCD-2024]